MLDGLRGVAVVIVMALHASLPFVRGGGLGVDLFFVLSGFLITALLVQEWETRGRIHLGAFYTRRALRLFPALGLLIVAYLLYVVIARPYGIGSGLRVAAATGTYLSNWVLALTSKQMDVLSHTWSLSIEEHFYLVWPVALLWMLRKRLSRAVIIGSVIGVIAAVIAVRHLLWFQGLSLKLLQNSTPTRMDALLIGCLTALLLAWNKLPTGDVMRKRLGWAAAISAGLLVGMCVAVSTDQVYPGFLIVRYTLVPVAAAVLILHLLDAEEGVAARMLRAPALRSIGKLSYGLYLWHFPVFMLCRMPGQPVLELALEIGITVLLVLASYHWVEQPFLRFKKRFSVV